MSDLLDWSAVLEAFASLSCGHQRIVNPNNVTVGQALTCIHCATVVRVTDVRRPT